MTFSRFDLDLVDWDKVKTVAEMVEARTLERSDMKFGPLKVTIYDIPGQNTLRIDFRSENG